PTAARPRRRSTRDPRAQAPSSRSRPDPSRATEAPGDLGDRGPLSLRDLLTVLAVSVRHLFRELDHERPVTLDFFGRRLPPEQLGGFANSLQTLLAQLFGGVRAMAALRAGGDELIEELALTVVLPRLGVCLRHCERLAER